MAFAAAISLKYTIHRLQNLMNFSQITRSACDGELNSLISVLRGLDDESSRMIDRSVIHELDAKIRDAVWKVEDVLDKYSLNISASEGGLDEKGVEEEMNSFLKTVKMLREDYYRVLLQNPLPAEDEEEEEEEEEEEDEALSLSAAVPPVNNSPSQGLDKKGVKKEMNSFLKTVKMLKKDVKQKMNSFLKKVKILREEYDRALSLFAEEEEEEEEEKEEALSFSAAIPPVNNSTTVGLSDLSHKIIHQLEERSYFTVVVSVVGMAGIGKTHLAALIYHHPLILQHFHVRLWLRLGPKYQPHNIYADILSQLLHKPRDLFKKKSERELIDLIESTLIKDQSYLIVLDDIWTTQVFETTTFTDAYENIYEVLLSSYEYLPQHLKPCFLYMGLFPQTCQIRISKLFNLWAVEDFLMTERQEQKLEKFAIECVEDLVSKSLAIVCKQRLFLSLFKKHEKIKSLKLHCAYWYVCVKEARKSKFFHVLKKLTDVLKLQLS